MEFNVLQRFLSIFRPDPKPEFIAQQLRRPSGDFAKKIGQKMNENNEPLYDLTLSSMELQDEDAILEIGFGNGRFFEKIFSKNSRLNISGIDYSQEMVEEAKAYNESSITTGRLNLYRGTSSNLPFTNGSFDKVFCNMVVYFWEEPEKHLREVYRVLKPNGRFYSGMRTRQSMLQFPFVEHGFKLYDQDQWRSILRRNGFAVIKTSEKTDPEKKYNGRSLRLSSLCIVAEKISG